MTDHSQESNAVRKSARLAAFAQVANDCARLDACSSGQESRRNVKGSSYSRRLPKRGAGAKPLKQKYRWLCDMDDEDEGVGSDIDGLSGRTHADSGSEVDKEDASFSSPKPNDQRCRLPDLSHEMPLSELVLPPSCDDLMVPMEYILQTVSIYEILRRFSVPLRLTQFRVEDFCAALTWPDSCRLLDEIHIAIVRTLIRSDELAGTLFTSVDSKDSAAITLFCGLSDPMTWFEMVHQYLQCLDSSYAVQHSLQIFDQRSNYDDLTLTERLTLLQTLVDLFMASETARNYLDSDGDINHEDQCRSCNRVGDLLCCENCPAVYHVECVHPPLTEIPSNEWICSVCTMNRIRGVSDCLLEAEVDYVMYRHEPVGFDRHGRKYWFICRRIFVEGEDGATWYYSSPTQLDELVSILHASEQHPCEVELVATINEIREEIVAHMNITADLVESYRGSKKSAIELHDGLIATSRKEAGAKAVTQPHQPLVNHDNALCAFMGLVQSSTSGLNGVGKEEEEEDDDDVVDNGGGVVDSDNNITDNTDSCSSSKSQNESVKSGEKEADSGDSLHEPVDDNSGSVTADAGVDVNSSSSVLDGECSNLVEELPKSQSNVPGSFPGWSARKSAVLEPPLNASIADSAVATRVTRSMTGSIPLKRHVLTPNVARMKSNTPQQSTVFKLGMEGTCTRYVNVYRTALLAASRQQKNDDRDKRRQLSNKFGVSQAGNDFTWPGALYGSAGSTPQRLEFLKKAVLMLEGNITTPFLHRSWKEHGHSQRWSRSVQLCATPQDFGTALNVLVACIKPLVFFNVWQDSIGHTSLRRTSALEREDLKKKEREMKRTKYEEDAMLAESRVIYTLGLRHQVWRQKGEEYRTSGGDGWYWISSTRVSKSGRDGLKRVSRDRVNLKQSCLDSLLNTRMRPLRAQARAMAIVEQHVHKFRSSEVNKSSPAAKLSSYRCYSAVCNQRHTSNSHRGCYSVTCRVRIDASSVDSKLDSSVLTSTSNGLTVSSKPDVPTSSRRKFCPLPPSVANIDEKIVYTADTRLPVSVNNSVPRPTAASLKKQTTTIPAANRFSTRSGQRSIFVLENGILHKLARKGGLQLKPPGFAHQVASKPDPGSWIYPCSRPTFRTAWCYRTSQVQSLSAVALQLKILHYCLRWDDMKARNRPSNSEASEVDSDVKMQVELLERRDIEPDRLRSEYLVERIITPLNIPSDVPDDRPLSQRTGLRDRKSLLPAQKSAEPTVTEVWTPEEDIELWRIKDFFERGERPRFRRKPAEKKDESKQRFSATQEHAARRRCSYLKDDAEDANWSPDTASKLSKSQKNVMPSKQSALSTKRKPGSLACNTSRRLTHSLHKTSMTGALSSSAISRKGPSVDGIYGKPTSAMTSTSVTSSTTGIRRNQLTSSPATNTLSPTKQSLRFTRDPDGKINVSGLLPNQELLQLPDGRFRLIFKKPVDVQSGDNVTSFAPWSSNRTTSVSSTFDENRKRSSLPLPTAIPTKINKLSVEDARKALLADLDRESDGAGSDDENDNDDSMPILSPEEPSVLTSEMPISSAASSLHSIVFSPWSGSKATQTTASHQSQSDSAMPAANQTNELCSSKAPASSSCDDKRSDLHSAMSKVPAKSTSPIAAAKLVRLDAKAAIYASRAVPMTPVQVHVTGLGSSASADVAAAAGAQLTRSANSTAESSSELHCICRTPYDETRFYIGCEKCSGWFHGSCVGVSVEAAQRMQQYVCDVCKKKAVSNSRGPEELHCICRQPYDQSKLYVACSSCSHWFHAECVGIGLLNLQKMSTYYCTDCSKTARVVS